MECQLSTKFHCLNGRSLRPRDFRREFGFFTSTCRPCAFVYFSALLINVSIYCTHAIVTACSELVGWYARLLYIVLHILQFSFGPNQSRIGNDTVYQNNVQLIINYCITLKKNNMTTVSRPGLSRTRYKSSQNTK